MFWMETVFTSSLGATVQSSAQQIIDFVKIAFSFLLIRNVNR
jgi:hypothetical protein